MGFSVNQKTAIITACYGDFDRVHPQVDQDIDVDWFYVTDKSPASIEPRWQVIVTDPSDDDPRLLAKGPKMQPWKFIPKPYQYYLWIDASMEITNPAFAREAIASIPQHKFGGVATWQHPRRDCVYEEAEASIGAESQNGKYDRETILEQVAYYQEMEYPEHAGLFACGTIAWEPRWWRAEKLGRKWFAENQQFSLQDQISFPVVAKRCWVVPGTFPFPQMTGWQPENPWLRIHAHNR